VSVAVRRLDRVTDAISYPTDDEVLRAFNSFVTERAEAGVLFAKALSSLMFDGSTLMATFDPSSVGVDEEAFLAANPFDSLAEFMGTPVAFADTEGQRLRQRVNTISATLRSGRDLGSVPVSSIYRAGTGQDWEPGK
jgi:hypothetical protein